MSDFEIVYVGGQSFLIGTALAIAITKREIRWEERHAQLVEQLRLAETTIADLKSELKDEET